MLLESFRSHSVADLEDIAYSVFDLYLNVVSVLCSGVVDTFVLSVPTNPTPNDNLSASFKSYWLNLSSLSIDL